VADVKNNEQVSILVVDDEPSVGDALKLILESKGYEVILVAKGTDGVEQARDRRFGFAIVDLFLKDTCGYRVIRDIHEHQPEMPILLITSHDDPQVFAKAQKHGALGALKKPFAAHQILTLIDSHLRGPTP
jgi:DNA-binding NtrC family response regulator